jgi:hypothetical protein
MSNETKRAVDTPARYDRALQVGGSVITTQSVTFENCLFIGNSIGPTGVSTYDGMITVVSSSNEVSIRNCTFQNNTYADPVNGVSRILYRSACRPERASRTIFLISASYL